jgi:ABC-2 type transport system permease protein
MKPSTTRQTLCVAQREYLATVRTKGFLIGLFVAPLLMFGAILAIPLFQGYRDTSDRHIAILDHTSRLHPAITNAAADRNQNHIHHPASGKKQAPAYLIEIIPPDLTNPQLQRLSLSDRVRSKNLHAFVEIGPNVIHPGTNSQNSGMSYHSPGAALDEARGWLANTINQQLRRLRLADAGLNEQQMPELFRSESLEPMSLLSTNTATGSIQQAERHNELQAVIGPAALALIMYLMILMAALPMLNAVMEEKTQRIAEVLLGSTPPFALMAGKVLSALAVALTGATIYVALGISSGSYLAALQYIPWSTLPWFLLYLCPAIIMFAALSTALGAACNDPKDAQNLTFPVILPAILPMFFLGPVLRDPASPLSTILSLFPPFTPVLMLIRLGHPAGAPLWQGALGLAGILLAATLSVWIASRIFRVAILTQGATPRLRDLLRWTLKG